VKDNVPTESGPRITEGFVGARCCDPSNTSAGGEDGDGPPDITGAPPAEWRNEREGTSILIESDSDIKERIVGLILPAPLRTINARGLATFRYMF
jgi:hypothetical protein